MDDFIASPNNNGTLAEVVVRGLGCCVDMAVVTSCLSRVPSMQHLVVENCYLAMWTFEMEETKDASRWANLKKLTVCGGRRRDVIYFITTNPLDLRLEVLILRSLDSLCHTRAPRLYLHRLKDLRIMHCSNIDYLLITRTASYPFPMLYLEHLIVSRRTLPSSRQSL